MKQLSPSPRKNPSGDLASSGSPGSILFNTATMRLPSGRAVPPRLVYWSAVPFRAFCLPVWWTMRTQQPRPRMMRLAAVTKLCSESLTRRSPGPKLTQGSKYDHDRRIVAVSVYNRIGKTCHDDVSIRPDGCKFDQLPGNVPYVDALHD